MFGRNIELVCVVHINEAPKLRFEESMPLLEIPLILLRMLESILAGTQVSAPIQYLIIY